jgi:hypothetical protein
MEEVGGGDSSSDEDEAKEREREKRRRFAQMRSTTRKSRAGPIRNGVMTGEAHRIRRAVIYLSTLAP